jgi:hypothetical protein
LKKRVRLLERRASFARRGRAAHVVLHDVRLLFQRAARVVRRRDLSVRALERLSRVAEKFVRRSVERGCDRVSKPNGG